MRKAALRERLKGVRFHRPGTGQEQAFEVSNSRPGTGRSRPAAQTGNSGYCADLLSASAVLRAKSSFTSPISTAAPASANRHAMALPRPCAAPVATAHRPRGAISSVIGLWDTSATLTCIYSCSWLTPSAELPGRLLRTAPIA